MLKNLLEHGTRMTCEVTKAELILVPSYHFKMAQEKIDEETLKRKIESEQNVKKAKVVKVEKAERVEGGGQKEETPKLLTDGVRARVTKTIEKLAQVKITAATAFVEANAEENDECVPKKIVKKMETLMQTLDELVTSGDKFLKDGVAGKSAIKNFWEMCKTRVRTSRPARPRSRHASPLLTEVLQKLQKLDCGLIMLSSQHLPFVSKTDPLLPAASPQQH